MIKHRRRPHFQNGQGNGNGNGNNNGNNGNHNGNHNGNSRGPSDYSDFPADESDEDTVVAVMVDGASEGGADGTGGSVDESGMPRTGSDGRSSEPPRVLNIADLKRKTAAELLETAEAMGLDKHCPCTQAGRRVPVAARCRAAW